MDHEYGWILTDSGETDTPATAAQEIAGPEIAGPETDHAAAETEAAKVDADGFDTAEVAPADANVTESTVTESTVTESTVAESTVAESTVADLAVSDGVDDTTDVQPNWALDAALAGEASVEAVRFEPAAVPVKAANYEVPAFPTEDAQTEAGAADGSSRPESVSAFHQVLGSSSVRIAAAALVVCVAILGVAIWRSSGSSAPVQASAGHTGVQGSQGAVFGNEQMDTGGGTVAVPGAQTDQPGSSASVPPSGPGLKSSGPVAAGAAAAAGAAPVAPAPANPGGQTQAQTAGGQNDSGARPPAAQVAPPRVVRSGQIAGFGQAVSSKDSKCIGASRGSTANGTAVDMYQCVNSATQQWSFYSDGTLRTGGKCMTVAGGRAVQLADCSGGQTQQWNLNSSHDLVNPNPDMCLDVKDRSEANYAVTQIWTCTGNSNQKWSLG